jgi:hypothetical protein
MENGLMTLRRTWGFLFSTSHFPYPALGAGYLISFLGSQKPAPMNTNQPVL